VTPSQRLRSIRSSRLLRINSAQPSPDGGILLGPSDATHTCSTTDNIFTNHGLAQAFTTSSRVSDADALPASPSRLANTRIRRCNNGSALLQSPARAGHAARMRQIFEDAGREQHTPQIDKGVLYPQLPNISRKASPPPEHCPSPIRRPESLCMSNASYVRRPGSFCMSTSSFRAVPQVTRLPVSEQSSEAWSDDSGYFIASSRHRTTTHAVCPRERIADWLEGVAACDGEGLQYAQDDYFTSSSSGTYKTPTQDPFTQSSSTTTPSLFSRSHPKPFSPQSTVVIKSYPSRAILPRTPQRSPSKEEGGISLSPLSPNVCVERGPARYHRRSNADHTGTPGPSSYFEANVERPAAHFRVVSELKENGRGRESPCKIGVGTRFQHARHGMGRWGGCEEL
jgi:hypothetical protein